MQEMKKMPVPLIFLLVIGALSNQPSVTESRSFMERELHPIDICIFTCDMCYKTEALVHCANECIVTEAVMGPFWTRTCKLFEGDILSGLHDAVVASNANLTP